jgi:ATP phosphoribosyltransferase regulatory subunit
MVFELHDPSAKVTGELVAGGRYDGLFARLGAAPVVPAVGFAVWLEGLVALGGAPGGIAPGGAA